MSELFEISATELSQRYADRSLSPVEAVQSILTRIDRHEPALNCFCVLRPDEVLAAARESEQRWHVGAPRGPLDGVPVSVKDLLHVEGWPTRHGSKAMPDRDSKFDAPSVRHVREGGAVLLGKTTTPEFGHKGVTESPLTGRTSNPWNVDLTCGGSSGGSAAAVAAGLGSLSIGTDGGGSCRKPANYCGVVGMKPSAGRVAAWPPSSLWPLSSAGPIARSAADAGFLLSVMMQPDSREPAQLPQMDLGTGEEVRGMQIAYSATLGESGTRPVVREVVDRAVRTFESLGARITEIDPGFENMMPVYRTLLGSALAAVAAGMTVDRRAQLDETMLAVIAKGESVSGADVQVAHQQRLRLARQMATFHETYDILVTPTNPVIAYLHGTREPEPEPGDGFSATTCFTYPFNMTGQPAISVPCGLTESGLPVGLQIVGSFGRDDLVLRAARAFETASGFAGQIAPL